MEFLCYAKLFVYNTDITFSPVYYWYGLTQVKYVIIDNYLGYKKFLIYLKIKYTLAVFLNYYFAWKSAFNTLNVIYHNHFNRFSANVL